MENKNYDDCLNKFLAIAQEKVSKNQESLPENCKYILKVNKGRTYDKIVTTREGIVNSAFCFVEKNTGRILKSASWNAPAKGVRGNIYDEDNGFNAITPYGAVYFVR